ncbi:MAG: tetratricopeptide repeat protein, partial [Myxococcota bacterium]
MSDGQTVPTEDPGVEDETFAAAAAAVRADAADSDSWDELEDFAAASQTPDEVAALYREVLGGELPSDVASDLAQRAVQFHEEWYREDSPVLVEVLSRVLEVDPTASEWAFQRLTVVYTVAERWDDLLALYDREIAGAVDAFRKATLLEEAAQTAKDFANAPDRAIDFMLQLLPLRRNDKQLVSSLERLLEKQQRWNDLVGVWRDQLQVQKPAQARATRLRIAEVIFGRLNQPGDAIAELRDLLDDPEAESDGPLAMLERVANDENIDAEARREALALLRERYAAEDRTTAVIATLGTALSLADTAERITLHRDAAARLRSQGALAEALGHLGSIVQLAPDDEAALTALREVAEEAEQPRRLVELLVESADAVDSIAERASLRLEAAERLVQLQDTAAAIPQLELLATTSDVDAGIARAASRMWVDQLGAAERHEEQLNALDRLSALEDTPAKRRDAIGRAARLAAQLSMPDRALDLWERRLSDDPQDAEALSECIALLEREERWAQLVTALRRRADTVPAAWQKRADLIRVARVQSESLGQLADAIATWNEVAGGFGEDAEVADALTALYESTERFEEMAAVLERASDREGAHLADIRARLGGVYGVRLQRASEALTFFHRALDADPQHAGARAGLAELCESSEPGVRAEAIETLAKSYELSGEWAPRLALLDERLAVAKSDAVRAERLREAAVIQENESEAPSAALASLLGVLAIDPDDRESEAAVLRLAEATEGWAPTVDGLRDAAAKATPARAAELRFLEAGLRQSKLEDPSGALDAALAALEAQPLRAEYGQTVLALATTTERWAEAEAVLANASEQPHAPVTHLDALVAVQRAGASGALRSTLARLAEGDPRDLDALRESADLSLESEDAVAALERLYSRAAGLWRRGASPSGSQEAGPNAVWAVQELVVRYDAAEHLDSSVSILTDAARLPVEEADAAAWRREAAKRAMSLGDRPTAIALFQDVIRVQRDDVESLAALGDLLRAEERLAELLSLRHHELSLTESAERRIDVRMEIARLVTHVEENGGRMEALRANLEERPGHEESLDALEQLLTARRGFVELADLLASQASRLEGDRAAGLWRRVASLAEGPLGDVERAVEAFKKVVEYEQGDIPAIDALSRIHRERGEHAAASRWLERRHTVSTPEERPALAGNLARALISAGRAERACEVLEMALEEAPAETDLRDLLADQYRKASDHEALARTLTEAAAHVDEQARVLELVREAAALYRDTLGRPADAIPVLRKGIELAPDDRSIKLQLAEGLRESGDLDEARSLLEQVIADFGRRRSAERAEVHYQLGVVARAQGDFESALEQLDKATKMAKADPSKLEMYGRMAREAGQLDRAEKAYRALLMTVRRQGPAEKLDVGSGEVLYELHAIANGRGEEEQAKELLESALEAAAQNDAEALRFRDALLERDEPELALRGLERRVQTADEKRSKALVLSAMVTVLEGLERHDEAFSRGALALENDPGNQDVQAAAVQSARKADSVPKLVETLESLVDKHKRGEDAEVQASLLVCLGEVTEADLGDPDQATSLFGRAEALLDRPIVAWLALARVGAKREDRALQRRVLEKLVDAEELSKIERGDALHQLANVLLRDPGALDDAVDVARRAFDADPRHADLIDGLDFATAKQPNHDEAMSLYQDIARDAGLEPLWLRFLERRAQREDATVPQVREAVDKARSLELDERVEPLLERAVRVAEGSEEGVAQARWAMRDLGQLRADAGDLQAAIGWMRRAVDTAEDEEERREMELHLAGFAAKAGDLTTAAETYGRLLETDLTDKNIWLPLL